MTKILFIDDDMHTLALMEKEAEILGYQPIVCPNSSDAIQYAVIFNPDLILIDINMQEFNGFEIVKQIRNYEQISHIPVLILSAGDQEIEGGKSLDAGANGFLSKPLTLSALESAVKLYVNHKINSQ